MPSLSVGTTRTGPDLFAAENLLRERFEPGITVQVIKERIGLEINNNRPGPHRFVRGNG